MKRDLELERAVYGLLEYGPMTPEKSVLYKKPLAAMVAEKLVRRTPEGGHELVSPSPVASAVKAALKKPVMVTLTARVPAALLQRLDAVGPSRSEALRSILEQALANTGSTAPSARKSA